MMESENKKPLSMLAVSIVTLICCALLYAYSVDKRASSGSVQVIAQPHDDAGVRYAIEDLNRGKLYYSDMAVDPHDSQATVSRGLAVLRHAWEQQCSYASKYKILSQAEAENLCPSYTAISHSGKAEVDKYYDLTLLSVGLCKRILVEWRASASPPVPRISGTDNEVAVMYCKSRFNLKISADFAQ